MSNAASLCLLIEPVQSPDAYKVSVPIPSSIPGVSPTEKLMALMDLINYINQLHLRLSVFPNQIHFWVEQQALTSLPAIFDRVWELARATHQMAVTLELETETVDSRLHSKLELLFGSEYSCCHLLCY